jgi:NADPH-dependent 2,4-dienoyl-CoA reductase/sulfur reductase-like enzyme
MKDHYELLIIGAGPAGMAAACEAAANGVDIALIDEQPAPGGQIYRNVTNVSDSVSRLLGKDYVYGEKLSSEFMQSGVTYIGNAAVWYIDEKLQVGVLVDGKSHFITADQLIVATGAQERPMPIPGWELPGVMTAGAGQILLKSAGMVPDGKLVLAGSGPLLLLVAYQYLQAGVEIEALVDTTPKGALTGAFNKLFKALTAPEYLIKGLTLMMAIRKAGVPVYKYASNLKANGRDFLESLAFDSENALGKKSHHELPVTTLLLHQGVIPNLRLAVAAGCEAAWDDQQRSFVVSADEWGQSSVPGVLVAGDGSHIMGARAAEIQGRLCGLKVSNLLGKLDRDGFDSKSKLQQGAIKKHIAIRPFLDSVYAPAKEFMLPADNTIVCRCEEVKAEQIREATRLGCSGPNQVKSFTRCGMGPCQGSQCASTVSALIADETNTSLAQVGFFRVRPPFKPITLGELSKT